MTDDGINPKDAIGDTKPDLSLIPPIANLHEAAAFGDGARKYGPYNWRDKSVRARVYIAAAKRHIDLWQDGEENASDSGVHHLGHARACLAIVLDAQSLGKLHDDRPLPGKASEVLAALTKKVPPLQGFATPSMEVIAATVISEVQAGQAVVHHNAFPLSHVPDDTQPTDHLPDCGHATWQADCSYCPVRAPSDTLADVPRGSSSD